MRHRINYERERITIPPRSKEYMHYEINVSLDGKHYFATHQRSLTHQEKAEEVFYDFCRRFPKRDGFKIDMSFHPGQIEAHMSSDEMD